MSKTIKELADDFGVTKQAIRNKITKEFREKWVQTITINGVQTLVVSDEGVNALKSVFQGANVTANQTTNQLPIESNVIEVYERQIETLQKLLDQSQQLLLNEQKNSQVFIETKSNSLETTNKEKNRLDLKLSYLENKIEKKDKEIKILWVTTAVAITLLLAVIITWMGQS